MTPQPQELPPAPEPLPHPVVDNHCHLDVKRRADDPEPDPVAALARARAVGVPRIVQIGCSLPTARWSVECARAHEQIVAGVALHPNTAPRHAESGTLQAAYDEIAALAADPSVRAVGETGLDYFRTPPGPGRQIQRDSFEWHIDLAKRLGKTLVIHDRDSHEDVLAVLDAVGAPQRWVMHCFSGDASFAEACLDRGAYLSFAGTVTFGNAEDLRGAAAITPSDRILVETDAPYLTPVPYRGRTNASHLIPWTMRTLAEVRGADLGELCVAVESNTFEAFGGAW